MNGELKDMEAFEAAMAEAGYHAPKRSPHNDGYFFYRDQDRYIGFKLARPTPAPGALPELPELPEPLDHLACADGFNVIGEVAVYTADQMHAYAHGYAEQCRAGVVVTDSTVERAVDAYDASRKTLPVWNDYRDVKRHMVRAALQSAFADDEGVRS